MKCGQERDLSFVRRRISDKPYIDRRARLARADNQRVRYAGDSVQVLKSAFALKKSTQSGQRSTIGEKGTKCVQHEVSLGVGMEAIIPAKEDYN